MSGVHRTRKHIRKHEDASPGGVWLGAAQLVRLQGGWALDLPCGRPLSEPRKGALPIRSPPYPGPTPRWKDIDENPTWQRWGYDFLALAYFVIAVVALVRGGGRVAARGCRVMAGQGPVGRGTDLSGMLGRH